MNHTRPAQGLPNEERVRDREGSVCVRERERGSVCVCKASLEQFCDLITMSKEKKRGKKTTLGRKTTTYYAADRVYGGLPSL